MQGGDWRAFIHTCRDSPVYAILPPPPCVTKKDYGIILPTKGKEEAMSEKKKVYVETTVVSDATALPTNDLALVGRQVATREWWETASKRFDLFVSPTVRGGAV